MSNYFYTIWKSVELRQIWHINSRYLSCCCFAIAVPSIISNKMGYILHKWSIQFNDFNVFCAEREPDWITLFWADDDVHTGTLVHDSEIVASMWYLPEAFAHITNGIIWNDEQHKMLCIPMTRNPEILLQFKWNFSVCRSGAYNNHTKCTLRTIQTNALCLENCIKGKSGCLARRLKLLKHFEKIKAMTNTTSSDYNSCSFSLFIVRCFDCTNCKEKWETQMHMKAEKSEQQNQTKPNRTEQNRIERRAAELQRKNVKQQDQHTYRQIFYYAHHFWLVVRRFMLLHLWWCF